MNIFSWRVNIYSNLEQVLGEMKKEALTRNDEIDSLKHKLRIESERARKENEVLRNEITQVYTMASKVVMNVCFNILRGYSVVGSSGQDVRVSIKIVECPMYMNLQQINLKFKNKLLDHFMMRSARNMLVHKSPDFDNCLPRNYRECRKHVTDVDHVAKDLKFNFRVKSNLRPFHK